MVSEEFALSKEVIEENPQDVGILLVELADAIQNSKDDIEEIQNRTWYKRVISNNVRDITKAMLKQNNILLLYFVIVQNVIMLTVNNMASLAVIIDAIERHEKVSRATDNKYIAIAKEYMTEALKAMRSNSVRDEEIKNLKFEIQKLETYITELEDNLKKASQKRRTRMVKVRMW